MRSYIVKKNHIWSVVSEILWYRQIESLLLSYITYYTFLGEVTRILLKKYQFLLKNIIFYRHFSDIPICFRVKSAYKNCWIVSKFTKDWFLYCKNLWIWRIFLWAKVYVLYTCNTYLKKVSIYIIYTVPKCNMIF